MTNRPNVLLITSDQQHYNTLGFANPCIQTPAFDRLAREGSNFTRAYCNNPVCSPSRSTIITGQYPSWHGCWTIGVKLPEDVPTVGQTFEAAGYDTSLIGKAHFQPLATQPGSESIECQPILRDLSFWDSFRGPWYGFRYVETARMHGDESHTGQHYALWMERKGLKNWRDYFQQYPHAANRTRRQHSWDLPEEFHYSRWTADKTIEFVREHVHRNRPFFTWASFHDPHPPYIVPEPWASMYDPADMPLGRFTPGEFDNMPPQFAMTRDPKADWSVYQEPGGNSCHGFHCHLHDEALMRKNMAVYYGMTSFMDQQIGRILNELDDLGVADNTLVVFTTDHGHFLGQHGLMAKGAFHYEDLIRLPFLVRWPGRVPAGTTNTSLQALIDLPSTFLDAAGVKVPGQMQGRSQVENWCSGGAEGTRRDNIICEFRHQPTKVHLRTLVNEHYKLTLYRGQDYGELFDLVEDPGETKNRWNDPVYADVRSQLLFEFMQAEICREPMRMPRIAVA